VEGVLASHHTADGEVVEVAVGLRLRADWSLSLADLYEALGGRLFGVNLVGVAAGFGEGGAESAGCQEVKHAAIKSFISIDIRVDR
jgi:hypothetical protein